MIPTDLVIAQLVPELHSTLTIGLGGALAIATVTALLVALVAGTIRDLRAETRERDRGGHGQPARPQRTRRAA
jgi:hypothetical protein